MAFLEPEKAKIRHALGYPDVFRDNNPRLESAIDVIGSRPAPEEQARAIIAEIDALLPQLSGSSSSTVTTGTLKRVDEIEFYPTSSGTGTIQGEVKKLGRMHVNKLSILFGVPIANDIFSARGYSGDWWAGYDIQVGGGGLIPLGWILTRAAL